MEFSEVLRKRRSTRAFQSKAVPPTVLDTLFHAMEEAPSAGNLQAFQILLIQKEETKKALAEACNEQLFVAEAPFVLVFFADPPRSSRKYGSRGAKFYCIQDATLAAAYFQLAATAEGLSTAWVGAFDNEKVCSVVRAPPHLIPVAIIPLGYAAETPIRYPRRRRQDLVKHEQF